MSAALAPEAHVDRARQALGFTAKFACEFEFFIFKETSESLYGKGFRGLTPLSQGMFGYSWLREGQNSELVHAILDEMAAFDIDIEALHTETGPGVYEVAIRYDEKRCAWLTRPRSSRRR